MYESDVGTKLNIDVTNLSGLDLQTTVVELDFISKNGHTDFTRTASIIDADTVQYTIAIGDFTEDNIGIWEVKPNIIIDAGVNEFSVDSFYIRVRKI